MTFFALTRVPNARGFTVKKLDLNLWILPGFLSQQYMCDVGIRLELESGSTKPTAVDLTLPFVADDEGMIDLVPSLRMSEKACNLVFGTNGAKVTKTQPPQHSGAALTSSPQLAAFDDGTGEFALVACDRVKSTEQHKWQPTAADGAEVSVWRLQAEHENLPVDSIYMRVRFKVDNPGKTWVWQPGVRRRAHSISDIRVSEFRTTKAGGSLPDYANDYLPADRVNAFVIMSAKYKVGRVSPEPKYVRVLESPAWEADYLHRRLSRRKEDFIITYWGRDAVTADKPLRAFIEVERRRPTALKSAMVASLSTILVILLALPVGGFTTSAAAVVLKTSRLLVAGLTLTAIVALLRLSVTVFGRRKKIRDFQKGLTRRMYRKS